MTNEQYLKNLNPPIGMVDVILDTDARNEIDDQFAISYMIKSPERLNVKGICAAPFYHPAATAKDPKDGMEQSYDEILKLLDLAEMPKLKDVVFKGSDCYLSDENTPVISDAAKLIASLADNYSPEKPLYIAAIGALTNVASAILLNPKITENCVVVVLGGNGHHIPNNDEFNIRQDIAASRIVFGCGVPLVQFPCAGVVHEFYFTKPELEYWLLGKNKLCDYLVSNTVSAVEKNEYNKNRPWSRVIWDVTAVGWLMNDNCRFTYEHVIDAVVPTYDYHYEKAQEGHKMKYVYHLKRDNLMEHLIKTLTK